MSRISDQLCNMLDALPEPVCAIGMDKRCIFANRAFAELLGYETGLTGRKGGDFWPGMETVAWEPHELTSEFLHRSGERIPVKVALFIADALVIRVLSSFSAQDEARNLHLQRLETLGMLAGGVAHDFNNILTGILGHLTYLKTVLGDGGQHSESLRAIEDGGMRATSLTQQIVRYAKLDAEERSIELDLQELVSRTVVLIKGAVPRDCTIKVIPAPGAVKVLGAEGKLTQVIVNLLINARDALGTKGQIEVELKSCSDRQRLMRILHVSDLATDEYSELIVRDNGHGMPEEVKARVFEPFFSTKKDRGTGLGLTTVLSIVRKMGGAIELESALDKGTRFSVFLPALAARAVIQAPKPKLDHVPGRGERILVVDDEQSVRNVMGLSLEHLGYAVELAASGTEALERYVHVHQRFDLVILDMLMPGMSGEETFHRLREIDETVRVLLVSGYTSEQAIRSVLDAGGKDFLHKPFTIELLSNKVRSALDD